MLTASNNPSKSSHKKHESLLKGQIRLTISLFFIFPTDDN